MRMGFGLRFLRFYLITVCLLCGAVLLAGCGGGSAQLAPATSPKAGDSPAELTADFQLQLEFPRVASGEAEPGAFVPSREGAEFAQDLDNSNVSMVASNAQFAPTAAAGPGKFADAAYSIYRLWSYAGADTTELNLVWDGDPPAEGTCWIGMSDWAQDNWLWEPLPPSGSLQLVPQTVANEEHQTLIAVVVTSGDPVQLANISLECTPNGTSTYMLLAPKESTTTYLLDMDGNAVRTWQSDYEPALSVYLLDNGHIVRIGKSGTGPSTVRRIEEFDWDGNLLWYFDDFPADFVPHHDIEPMPNGNILVVASQKIDTATAEAAGRELGTLSKDFLKVDTILEVRPGPENTGEIVWSWNVFDHMVQDYSPAAENYGVVADHPELLDINFDTSEGEDYAHANAVDYNAELDQIVICFRGTDELYVIDHSTSTEEAATHSGGLSGMGGDFLYRWGNPQAYDQGDADDRQLYKQHDVEWIPTGHPGEGNLLIFNNGLQRPGGLNFSDVLEIKPPLLPDNSYLYEGGAYGPVTPDWTYVNDPPELMYSNNMSSSQRLPNGNTLICMSLNGQVLEVSPIGEIVWEYTNDYPNINQNVIFRADRYDLFDPDFPME